MRRCVLLLLAATLHAQNAQNAQNAQSVLVLTPDTFRPALTKWQRHRESQGFKVTVRSEASDMKGFAYVLLLGDPTMRIPLPAKAKIGATRDGDKLEVTGNSPVDGEALIELVTRRTPNRPRRTDDTTEAFRKAYERANRRQVAKTSVQIREGAFKTTFDVPARGKYILRIFVSGKAGTAAGAAKVVVE